ncbi:MAG: (deoxy)nucleoside triphosphate pyrophosphohydrolase [Saprospiraceae bacterium]|nr:(deoxy)nucleoside triphosphate pyrophosphohydrolase [Saprospiraceae bacterium]
MKKVEVVAAVIFWEDLVLCVQRPKNKLHYISEKFEFPGGKIEKGETKEEALVRELLEELNLSTKIESFFLTVVHEYPDFELTMHSYLCKVESKDLILHEHIDSKWLKIDELSSLDWAAADIPIVEKIILNG